MKRVILGAWLACAMLSGCAYHPQPVAVYGRSGAAYLAPDLCAALTKCLNGPETSCFYNKSVYQTATSTETSGCKEVKK